MKKSLIHPLVFMAAAAGLWAGCFDGQQGGGQKEAGRSETETTVAPDTAFYGHLGEGTGMSCLELVTESGDTLVLNKTDERTGDPGRILGEIANYTDRYAITTRNDGQSVLVALNVSQLVQREWASDADSLHAFRLEADGKAQALPAGTHEEGEWGLYNCQLVLQEGHRLKTEGKTRKDTLDILELTPDSLVLQDARTHVVERFHRTTQTDDHGNR